MDYPLLDALTGPDDLKSLDGEGLLALADELRRGLIQTISRVGGHFAPNLGVIELTLALYKVFDVPRDKVIWDVGHQCYPHKMLTGRWKQLPTIKQFGGISGFLRRDESPFDVWGAGHASTSLSAALGFAKARDLKGTNEKVVGIIGDGALTGGMALEALLNAADLKTDVTFILNDNKMSIAENVGAMSTYLAKLRLQPLYQRVERRVKRSLKGTGLLYDLAAGAKHAATHFAAPSNTGVLFEEMGLQYIGPIDGHDLPFLVDVFEHVKHIRGPVLVHVLTTKGKGYENAEQDSRVFHAVTPFTVEDGKFEKKATGVTFTQAFVDDRARRAAAQRSGLADRLGGLARSDVGRGQNDFGALVVGQRGEPAAGGVGLTMAELAKRHIDVAHVDVDHQRAGLVRRVARDIALALAVADQPQPRWPILACAHHRPFVSQLGESMNRLFFPSPGRPQ